MVVRLRAGNPELLDDLLQFLDRRAAPRRSSEAGGEPGDNRSLRQNRCTSPGTREGRAPPFMSIAGSRAPCPLNGGNSPQRFAREGERM